MIKAVILEQQEKKTIPTVKQIEESMLPEGNVTVDVEWSGINYKDAMAVTGTGKIIRQFPMVPGIDFAGKVSQSDDPRYQLGQEVILTGWGVGETHWGGMAEKARINADWLVHLPEGMSSREAMIIGTAGFTAMLCVMGLEDGHVKPEDGEILVTGASGGVGSTAVVLLNALGYNVVAVTGRPENEAYLLKLGAKRVISRQELEEDARPLEKQLWVGAIDTVGGKVLAKLLAQMNYDATVSACGLAGSYQLPTTVMPFILRNVRLQGIDSVMAPLAKRELAWKRLHELLPASYYTQVTTEISLDGVAQAAHDLIANKITGRTLVKVK